MHLFSGEKDIAGDQQQRDDADDAAQTGQHTDALDRLGDDPEIDKTRTAAAFFLETMQKNHLRIS